MRSAQLSDLQLSVMQVLWQQREATVADVQAALASQRDLALTTVATLLSRLEKRGLVAHRREGRQYVYRPLATEQDVRRGMISRLAERLFRGDVTELVCHLLSARELDPEDLARVRAFLRAREQEAEGREDDGQQPG